MRSTTVALGLGLLATATTAPAQTPGAAALEPSTTLQRPPAGGDAARRLPIVLQADRVSGQPEQATVAEGDVEFRRGGLVIRADRLSYDTPGDLAVARGKVVITNDGARYSGPELRLQVQRFEGWFLQPEFDFPRLAAGGRADRLEFLGEGRLQAVNARYTSCPRDGPHDPAWVLEARRVGLDLETNEGVAEGAVLRFLGTPILALPTMSFPLGDQRRSGWLPPSVNIDSRGGVELAVPYYWNLAPNRDATLVPRVISRRGAAIDAEFRYLEPAYNGSAAVGWLPQDRIAGRSRHSLQWTHDGDRAGLRYGVDLVRVSDDDWWKDFRGAGSGLTTRLLPLRLGVERPFLLLGAEGATYARVLRWQVLQSADAPIASPYQRSPQIGARWAGAAADWLFAVETEFNRFTLPDAAPARAGRADGDRVHLLASISRPWRGGGGWLVPRLSLNAAHYEAGAGGGVAALVRNASGGRAIPSFSVDAGLVFERRTQAFGRALQQTLEPRLLYVNTPYRAQSGFPVYDAAAKDFNFVSIYTDNAFSGVDRVSDAHQVTAGATTRLVDAVTGAEALRLGVVQRYLLRGQRVTAQPDGTPDGAPLAQRFSDLLLLGSTSVLRGWTLDAAVQYSPDIARSVRSIVGARWSPGPYRTVGATYRMARGLSEQVELAWQWPVWGTARGDTAPRREGGSCAGALYSVGRVNYSVRDSRTTDSVLGLEYDAGCWIGRVVAERLSTGRSEATTRLLLQLELVGLSRLGANPLQVLKDNIPGYRLLRDERRDAEPVDSWQP